MGLSQSSVSASDVVQNTHVSIEEAEELLSAFQKCGGKPIGLEDFKKLLLEVQHLYDSPAFSPDAADLYFRIFDTAHDGLSNVCPPTWLLCLICDLFLPSWAQQLIPASL